MKTDRTPGYAVISITRGQTRRPRKLNIEDEKILTEFFWETLYLLDVLRERLGSVIADGIELRKSGRAAGAGRVEPLKISAHLGSTNGKTKKVRARSSCAPGCDA